MELPKWMLECILSGEHFNAGEQVVLIDDKNMDAEGSILFAPKKGNIGVVLQCGCEYIASNDRDKILIIWRASDGAGRYYKSRFKRI